MSSVAKVNIVHIGYGMETKVCQKHELCHKNVHIEVLNFPHIKIEFNHSLMF